MRSAAVLLQCHSRLITYLSSSISVILPIPGPLSFFLGVFFIIISLISSCIFFVVIKTTSPQRSDIRGMNL